MASRRPPALVLVLLLFFLHLVAAGSQPPYRKSPPHEKDGSSVNCEKKEYLKRMNAHKYSGGRKEFHQGWKFPYQKPPFKKHPVKPARKPSPHKPPPPRNPSPKPPSTYRPSGPPRRPPNPPAPYHSKPKPLPHPPPPSPAKSYGKPPNYKPPRPYSPPPPRKPSQLPPKSPRPSSPPARKPPLLPPKSPRPQSPPAPYQSKPPPRLPPKSPRPPPSYPSKPPPRLPPKPAPAPAYRNKLAKQFLDPHNAARASLGLPPMVWNDTVAKYAEWWADQRRLHGNCQMKHSDGPYGENLFWGIGIPFTPGDCVEAWVNEKPFYHYSDNSCDPNEQCGHYTQIIWKTSVRLGCARVECDGGDIFMTCNYDPPGNWIGYKPY